jgi:hypothetical protein
MLQRLIYICFDVHFGLILLRAIATKHLLSLTSSEKSSSRAASMVRRHCHLGFMVVKGKGKGKRTRRRCTQLLLGCTVAWPLDTGNDIEMRRGRTEKKDDKSLTKPFLRGASTLNCLHKARPEHMCHWRGTQTLRHAFTSAELIRDEQECGRYKSHLYP